MNNDKPIVGIIMGSDSDLELMQEASDILTELGISFEITIVSAHRTPEKMFHYAKDAQERGLQVIIACAGGSAHLPGMIASLTTLPVIGVPRKIKPLKGLDSLLSIVQMPNGIPVATVAIDGAKNAGLLAARIIGVTNSQIREKLETYRKTLERNTMDKAEELEKVGSKEYLKAHQK
jgi:5-(carboxyamino)imidazole ribonucleotide mutase